MGSTSLNTDYSSQDIGIAFAMTILAGVATALGGAVVFLPQFSKPNHKWLSGGMALGAGAITYLAFAHMYPESQEFHTSAADTEEAEQLAAVWATLSFFGGVASMYLLAAITDRISPHSHNHDGPTSTENHSHDHSSPKLADQSHTSEVESATSESLSIPSVEPCDSESLVVPPEEKWEFWRSGLTTAFALVLHNIPTGIIIFVGTVNDSAVGAALAIGISLHSIPEGTSIALPLYFATGSKLKAFLITCVVALAPFIGGLLAFVLTQYYELDDAAFGALYGFAAGMLIYISVKHMLKMAYRYDPADKVTTNLFFLGMAMIALALVVLQATGNHDHGGHGEDVHNHDIEEDPLAVAMDDQHHDHDHLLY